MWYAPWSSVSSASACVPQSIHFVWIIRCCFIGLFWRSDWRWNVSSGWELASRIALWCSASLQNPHRTVWSSTVSSTSVRTSHRTLWNSIFSSASPSIFLLSCLCHMPPPSKFPPFCHRIVRYLMCNTEYKGTRRAQSVEALRYKP